MAARIQLANHLTTDELERRYRAATRSVEVKRFQVLWLLSEGWYSEDVAEAVGYTVFWVRKFAGFYNEGGPAAMLDGRRDNPGNEPLLDEEGRAALRRALEEETPPGGGQWNGPKVVEWMSAYLGRHVWPSRGWDYLRYMDYPPRHPRPRHKRQRTVKRSGGIKVKLEHRVRREERNHARAKVELWAMHEHRVGLKAHSPKGLGIKGRKDHERGYTLATIGSISRPSCILKSCSTSFWLTPTVNKEVFLSLLRALAKERGAGKGKRTVLVLDNTRWHLDESEVPEGITLDFLPPYSPELQPAERLWMPCDEPLVNRSYDSINDLDQALGARCVELSYMPEVISAHTLFHWWLRTRKHVYN